MQLLKDKKDPPFPKILHSHSHLLSENTQTHRGFSLRALVKQLCLRNTLSHLSFTGTHTTSTRFPSRFIFIMRTNAAIRTGQKNASCGGNRPKTPPQGSARSVPVAPAVPACVGSPGSRCSDLGVPAARPPGALGGRGWSPRRPAVHSPSAALRPTGNGRTGHFRFRRRDRKGVA